MISRRAAFLVALALASAPLSARADAETCAEDGEAASDARDAGHYRDARARFERCAVEACPKIVRDDCRAGIAWLRTDAPTLVVRARSAAGADVAAAKLVLDGAPLGPDEAVAGVLVDLGPHVLNASAPGFDPREERIVVGKQDHGRAVDLLLSPTASASMVPAKPSPPIVERDHTAAFVAFGVGAAALTVFGVVGAISFANYQDLHDTCPRCDAAAIDRAHGQAIAADVALGIGVAAVVAGTVLWLLAPRHVRASAVAPFVVRF